MKKLFLFGLAALALMCCSALPATAMMPRVSIENYGLHVTQIHALAVMPHEFQRPAEALTCQSPKAIFASFDPLRTPMRLTDVANSPLTINFVDLRLRC